VRFAAADGCIDLLIFAEELLLLAIEDTRDRVHGPAASTLHCGLAGAARADRALMGAAITDDSCRLVASEESPGGDDTLRILTPYQVKIP
jgi:hypothetical protein